MPKLRSKPNALTPFELRVEHAPAGERGDEASQLSGLTTPAGSAGSASSPRTQGVAASWYANPYSAEIADFAPSEAQLLPGPERMPWPLHQTPCMWVATEAALQQVAWSQSS